MISLAYLFEEDIAEKYVEDYVYETIMQGTNLELINEMVSYADEYDSVLYENKVDKNDKDHKRFSNAWGNAIKTQYDERDKLSNSYDDQENKRKAVDQAGEDIRWKKDYERPYDNQDKNDKHQEEQWKITKNIRDQNKKDKDLREENYKQKHSKLMNRQNDTFSNRVDNRVRKNIIASGEHKYGIHKLIDKLSDTKFGAAVSRGVKRAAQTETGKTILNYVKPKLLKIGTKLMKSAGKQIKKDRLNDYSKDGTSSGGEATKLVKIAAKRIALGKAIKNFSK